MKNKLNPSYGLFLIFFLISLLGFDLRSHAFHSFELKERNGVKNTFYKLKNRDTVKVAYLGGSITAQPGWRILSRNWMSENFPKTKVVEINAAIGGTGSPFGVYRLKDQVLKYHPDLVFVEFAVNDASTNEQEITKSMEGIVRQIWNQDPATDICFVYTIKEDFLEDYLNGKLPKSIATMEKIANHYQIPSINFGPEVVRRVSNGQLLFKGNKSVKDTIAVFSPDGVHPYPDSGHKVYSEVFAEAFSSMKTKSTMEITPHKLVPSLMPNPLVDTRMVSWTEVDSNHILIPINIKNDPVFKGFSKYFGTIGVGRPGDSISFQFRGRSLGFYDLMGPGSGTILLTIDGKKWTFDRFDMYCNYWRMSYKTLNNLEEGTHNVTIQVLDKKIDKSAILAKNGRKMDMEKNYEDKNWYLARILIDGDLIE
ncbi:SGNH/GDSL hydrolase family protein [Pedobacter sp. Du54]|uniref:SGNH/GDSL hydrolase family protein n=1 Tax=Pedobacter anseongensis TaxID=3133439 RepID=UPI0030ACBD6F